MVLSIVEVLPLQDLCGNATEAFFIQLLGEQNIFVKRTENSNRNVYGVYQTRLSPFFCFFFNKLSLVFQQWM